MAGETSLTVVGNLTADPELRYTQSGRPVVNLTIASTPRKFDKATNQWVDEETLFVRATVWGEYANHVALSLSKGTGVMAVGSLVQRAYETKDGEKRTSYEMVISEIGPHLRFATAIVSRATSPVSSAFVAPEGSNELPQQSFFPSDTAA